MSRAMTKPKKLRDERTEAAKDERMLPQIEILREQAEFDAIPEQAAAIVQELLTPKRLTMEEIIGRYVPPECSSCCNLQLPNRRTTYVNGTKTINTKTEIIIERSIKCPVCRASRMDYERIPHSILHQQSTAAE